MTDRTLTAALAELPVAYPPLPDLDAAFARLAAPAPRRPVPRLRWAMAAVIVVVAAVITFVTPVREAVADWLGIGAVRIVEVEEIPADVEDSIGDLGTRVSIGEVADLLGIERAWPEAIGAPDAAFVRRPDEPAVELSAVWLPADDLPEVGAGGVGALLTRFDGALDGPVAEKTVGEGTGLATIAVGDAPGYWISGEVHTFGYVGPDGEVVFETLRLAGNTLLWEQGGFSYRLESGLDLEAAIAVAETLVG